jgi:uncharacterized protein (DUF697 family)
MTILVRLRRPVMTETPKHGLEASAMAIVYRYMAISAGAALVPLPGIDTAVLAGVHVALIKQLCDHYGVSFSEHTARNLVIAIVGSVIPGTVGSILGHKALALLPTAARVFGLALFPISSAAFSYGIGRLFISHFESGGTLLSFDTRRLHRAFGDVA